MTNCKNLDKTRHTFFFVEFFSIGTKKWPTNGPQYTQIELDVKTSSGFDSKKDESAYG